MKILHGYNITQGTEAHVPLLAAIEMALRVFSPLVPYQTISVWILHLWANCLRLFKKSCSGWHLPLKASQWVMPLCNCWIMPLCSPRWTCTPGICARALGGRSSGRLQIVCGGAMCQPSTSQHLPMCLGMRPFMASRDLLPWGKRMPLRF